MLNIANIQSVLQKEFDNFQFISGTLGIESQAVIREFENQYKLSQKEIYIISLRDAPKMEDKGTKICKTTEEKHNSILKSVKEKITTQPILISVVSTKELMELEAKLKQDKTLSDKRILTFSAASQKDFEEDIDLSEEEIFEKYKETKKGKTFKEIYGCTIEEAKINYEGKYNNFIKGESGKKNVITIGTSIVGRGTNIEVKDEEILKNGGLHVIVDGLHETSSRNQEQAKWRTSRGTNPGSTEAIFSIEDIAGTVKKDIIIPEELPQGIDENSELANNIYQQYYEIIDEKTANAREWTGEFVKYTDSQAIDMNELILRTIGTPNITKEQDQIISKVTAMFFERSYNIQHRSLGITKQERGQEYKNEINMFAEMYYEKARCLLTNEKEEHYNSETQEFDEIKWLKNNGHEEIVDKYFQFSEEEKKQMFSKYGIIDILDNEQITMAEINQRVNETKRLAQENIKSEEKEREEEIKEEGEGERE